MKNLPLLLIPTGFVLLLAAAFTAYRGAPGTRSTADTSVATATGLTPITFANDTLLTLDGRGFGLRPGGAGTFSLRDSTQASRLLDALNATLPRLGTCLTPATDRLTAADLRRRTWNADRLGGLLDLETRLATAPSFRQLSFRDAVLTALVSRLARHQPLYPTDGPLSVEAPFTDELETAPGPPPAPDWTLPALLFGLGLASLGAGLLTRRVPPVPAPAAQPISATAPIWVDAPVPEPPKAALDKARLHERVLLALLRNYPAARRQHGPDVDTAALLSTEYNQLVSSEQDPFSDEEYGGLVSEAEGLVLALHPHQDYAQRLYETFYLTPEGRDVLSDWDQAGQTADLVEHFVKTSTHARSFLKFYLGRTVGDEDEMNRRLLLDGGRVPGYEAQFRVEEFRDDSRLMPPSVRLIQQLATQHGVRDLDNVVFKNAVYIPRQALTPKP